MYWLRWHYHVKDIAGAPYKIKKKKKEEKKNKTTDSTDSVISLSIRSASNASFHHCSPTTPSTDSSRVHQCNIDTISSRRCIFSLSGSFSGQHHASTSLVHWKHITDNGTYAISRISPLFQHFFSTTKTSAHPQPIGTESVTVVNCRCQQQSVTGRRQVRYGMV